jgi:putative toxin-antitoxin system antitoxin component (TIGR02293 family)
MSIIVADENDEIKKRIIMTLGLKSSDIKFKEKDRGMLIFHSIISKGIPYANIRFVKAALNVTDNEIADYLGISVKTLHRKLDSQEKLSIPEGDRLFRIARIFALAVSMLGSEEMARKWLHRAQRGLEGWVPLQLIQTYPGAQAVSNLLSKIKMKGLN